MQEWRPVLGAGSSYHFARDWMASVSWMHFMGGTSYSPAGAVLPGRPYVSTVAAASDVVMFNLGYQFTV